MALPVSATIVNLMATGNSHRRILQSYPQLKQSDIKEALAYASAQLTAGATPPLLLVRVYALRSRHGAGPAFRAASLP